jgi:Reverse transcriptase (RNA-dependent DNA polymerase)
MIQSAYRPFHSTETSVICVVNNVIKVLEYTRVGALIILDLSAAFDTVNARILKDVMQRQFGVRSNAVNWLFDFLKGRTQIFETGECESAVMTLKYEVLQGLFLGPKQFIARSSQACCRSPNCCITCLLMICKGCCVAQQPTFLGLY